MKDTAMKNNVNFESYIKDGKLKITLANGEAKYSMSRGSFKTKDRILESKELTLLAVDQSRYLFGNDQKALLELVVEKEEHKEVIHFHPLVSFNRFQLTYPSNREEHFFGTGEQYTTLDLKGKSVKVWVSEHQQVMAIAKKVIREKLFGRKPRYITNHKKHQTYYASPTYLSSDRYFVSVNSDAYGCFDFTKEDETTISFREVPQTMTVYHADDYLSLLSYVSKDLGTSVPEPDFVNDGIILAVQGGSQAVLEKYHKIRDHGGRISALWAQDWSGNHVTKFGYQVYWNWEYSQSLYPELPKMIENLEQEGVRFFGYINTFLKENSPMYVEAKINDYLVKNSENNVYLIQSTTFNAGIVDLTNPKAFQWFKNVIKENMIGIGLKGWMADFGEYLPTDARVYGGDPEKLHNLWPTLWAKCNYDAVKETGNEGKIFVFSRAAYQDTLRYTNSIWAGDQHVDFSYEYGLPSVVPAMLSMTCSGAGHTHSDVGGYTTVVHMKRDAELFIRWGELNVFTPIFRTHEGNRPDSNKQSYDEDLIPYTVRFSKMFAHLKPYREALLKDYYDRGISMVRPMFFHYDDPKYYQDGYEYMFGDDVFVSPVLDQNVKEKTVHIMEDGFVQFFTNQEFNKGTYTIETPLGMPIAFYRKDSKFREVFETLRLD